MKSKLRTVKMWAVWNKKENHYAYYEDSIPFFDNYLIAKNWKDCLNSDAGEEMFKVISVEVWNRRVKAKDVSNDKA